MFLLYRCNCFVYQLTQLCEHKTLICTMASSIEQTRATSDITFVFIGPFDNFHIPIGSFHFRDSSIAD